MKKDGILNQKKKIAFINVVCNGSTGKIMCDTALAASKEGYETYCFFGRGSANKSVNSIKIGNKLSILFHVLLARIGFNGYGSYFETKKLIKKLKDINPDIIHMHNIHGYYLNLKVLFNYLNNEYTGKVIWMLHDCWAYTGHCAHYVVAKCSKWQDCCHHCPQLNSYPKEFIDTTKREYKLKKELFNGLKNVLLITPSYWLENEVKKSFLNKYPIKTIYNGIDLNIFKRIEDKTIYSKYNIPASKKIILGVANVWDDKKGLNTFLELSHMLSKDEIIVLVGLNEKQISELPKNIIGISRTENQTELAKIYSCADVFINPSEEETFSMVTVEAMACGTPAVVCGKSAPKEIVSEETGVVLNNSIAIDYYNAYLKLINNKPDQKKLRDHVNRFSKEKMTEENLNIYKEC